ncbi:DNA-binding response regulator [bacterium]|nr:DNA-binding response regulator [bacterium]
METGVRGGDSARGRFPFARRSIEIDPRAIAVLGSAPNKTAAPLTKAPPFDLLAVIDNRALERECFVLCLQQQCQGSRVVGYESVSDWQARVGASDIRQVILTNIGSKPLTDEGVRAMVKEQVAMAGAVPVVVLGASEDLDTVIAALECGAAGYIPPAIHIANIEDAASLAVAGGVFFSRKSVFALREGGPPADAATTLVLDQFTTRQRAVAQVLRRGAANKTIAYELKLRESTVKVHVRQIFKKLKATNRTQAAFLLNQMTGWSGDPPQTKD